VFKTFFPNTRCKISNEMRAFIYKLLKPKPSSISKPFSGSKTLIITTLLYSGHLHGWNVKDFHDRCDSKGRTVSLFQIKDGDCIGGYTSQCWESPESWKLKADSSAFLFNLTRSCHFPSKATGKDIFCSSSYGPCFHGGNGPELATWGPFNGKDYCGSWVNKPGYNIPLVDGINQLTNQADGKFTISEIEVWLVEEE
jgi:hypothetical protein